MQAVLDYLKENEARSVGELCEYIRFASVSAQPQHRPDLQACAEWVVKHCQGIGLEARLCATEGNPIVVAKRRRSTEGETPLVAGGTPAPLPRRPHFLIYGHYDVQPPEPFELWKSPPFEPRIEGRSIFG